MVEVRVEVVVDAPPVSVWQAVTDWQRQSEWMLGTRVWPTAQDGVGVGGGIEAFTGVGRLGFLDTMVITEWDPPRRCTVRHTGRVVRGLGVFEVVPVGHRSRLVWVEQLTVPLGPPGRLAWALVAPAFRAGVRSSLLRLARAVEAEQRR